MDEHEQFRAEVVDQGLAWQSGYRANEKHFFFDLNQGQLYASPNPENVMKIVKLARKAADDDFSGEHNALLQLVAERSKTGNDRVYWARPYHVDAYNHPEKWISLAEWLRSQGQDPDSIYSPEYLAARNSR